jgi:hypothetical protein
MKMSFDQFVNQAENYRKQNPGLRLGQAYMNYLHEASSGLYHAIPWDLDPYYSDKLFPVFLQWVKERWDMYLQPSEDN